MWGTHFRLHEEIGQDEIVWATRPKRFDFPKIPASTSRTGAYMLHEWYLAISIICLLVIAEGVHRLTRQLGYLTAVAEHTSSMAKALWRIREELEWMRNGKTDEKMYSEAQAILSEVEENEKKC